MLLQAHLKKKLKHYKNTNIIVSLLSQLDLQRLIWMISNYFLNFWNLKSIEFHYLWENAS